MDVKKINVIWSVSLLIISIATIILAGANIVGIDLPDVFVRVLGVIDLVAVPFLVFSTIKKFKKIKKLLTTLIVICIMQM